METQIKSTMWTPLPAAECEIVDRNEHGGIRLKHPQLSRPRWFNPSQRGNYVSRYTGKATEVSALGFIVVGTLAT